MFYSTMVTQSVSKSLLGGAILGVGMTLSGSVSKMSCLIEYMNDFCKMTSLRFLCKLRRLQFFEWFAKFQLSKTWKCVADSCLNALLERHPPSTIHSFTNFIPEREIKLVQMFFVQHPHKLVLVLVQMFFVQHP